VSSPGDVGEERAIVHELLDRELKYDPAFRGKLSFEVVSWDNPISPTPMTARLTPQEAVNRFRAKPSDCDVVIVILWSRLGTHLVIDGKPYLSGTEYEYGEAANAELSPEILVYRRTEKVLLDADDPEFELKREQRQNALAFFDRFKNPDGSLRGGFNEYTTPTDFKQLLGRNLREILTERLQADSVAQLAVASVEAPIWYGEPYPGLRAFSSDEAAIFFGRGRETDALVAELRKPNRRFTAVVGASGLGKSSLVYAGLLPRLAEGAIEGSADWRALCFRPGAFGDNPFLALAAALKPLLPPGDRNEPIVIADALAKTPDSICTYVDRVLASAPLSARLVLFCDQSEELLAQAAASQRESFVDLLAEATGDPRVHVVLTMREDLLIQATRYPRLAALLQTGAFVLGAPGPASLADMIRRPAQLAGLALDEELADEILKDMGSEPGALPLVAFCLEALYRSSGTAHHLTVRAYEDLGRLQGAIRSRVAELLSPLEENEGFNQGGTLPKLFRMLVHVDAAGAVSRRRAFRDQLTAEPMLERIVELLVQGRLLLADDPSRATVSLAHEVLVSAWPALELWVAEHRAQLQRLDRLMLSLNSANPLDRKYAVEGLAEMGPALSETVPSLIAALRDTAGNVRASAIEALGKIGPPAAEAVPVLITALGDSNVLIRAAAAEALGRIGPPAAEAVPVLITALGDADALVREKVAEGLGEIGSAAAEAVPALITTLSDVEFRVGAAAAKALGKIGPTAAPALVAVLVKGVVRQSANKNSGEIGAGAVQGLVSALGDAVVLSLVAKALGEIGPASAEAVPTLITALRDSNELMRAAAAEALGKFGLRAAEAVPALITALGDANETVRENAERSLGQIENASLALEATPEDQSEEVS
jgi:HEAT repeat protein